MIGSMTSSNFLNNLNKITFIFIRILIFFTILVYLSYFNFLVDLYWLKNFLNSFQIYIDIIYQDMIQLHQHQC